MTFKNIYGRKGNPVPGFPSLAAARRARREEKIQGKIDQIAAIKEAEQFKKDRRDAHFGSWIAARCLTDQGLTEVTFETPGKILLADYRQWCTENKRYEETPHRWGFWMGQHFTKAVRNSRGVGRVYIGIILKPAAPIEPQIYDI